MVAKPFHLLHLRILHTTYQKHRRLLSSVVAAGRGGGGSSGLAEDGEEDSGEEDLVRLPRRHELGDHSVDDVRRREEVDEHPRQDVADEPRFEGARAAHAVEQDGDLRRIFGLTLLRASELRPNSIAKPAPSPASGAPGPRCRPTACRWRYLLRRHSCCCTCTPGRVALPGSPETGSTRSADRSTAYSP